MVAATKEWIASETAPAANAPGILEIGDLVTIAPGTLAWSAETLLRKQTGRVISTFVDEKGDVRVSVEFPRRKILAGRRAHVFRLVRRTSHSGK